MLAPVLETAPAVLVDLADAKRHCRVEHDEENALITSLVAAATSHLDGWDGVLRGRALGTQTWRQDFTCFADRISLPLAPVQSVTSIKYYDFDGVLQTVAPADYALFEDALSPYVCLASGASWPASVQSRVNAVQIVFLAGYVDVGKVPDPIKQAILLLVGHWYENREAVNVGNITTELPMAVAALIAPYRRIGL